MKPKRAFKMLEAALRRAIRERGSPAGGYTPQELERYYCGPAAHVIIALARTWPAVFETYLSAQLERPVRWHRGHVLVSDSREQLLAERLTTGEGRGAVTRSLTLSRKGDALDAVRVHKGAPRPSGDQLELNLDAQTPARGAGRLIRDLRGGKRA